MPASGNKPKRLTLNNYLKYYYDIPYEGTTSQGKPLRKLKNITCPYRGIKIIPADALRGFEKQLLKCKTADMNGQSMIYTSAADGMNALSFGSGGGGGGLNLNSSNILGKGGDGASGFVYIEW